ncbi:hypothetical protein E5676_scaffold263G00370 [Cucumis melo var. makuwa]|uniref:Retrotransposable element Tf2 n=1 Tax=Cucumis melo var. makuwa TaxID=1194695 RepID=A0A5D3CI63_CUCMM|nr:hypothetical protein E6C27_scaffold19G00840 [Cucumis melo var. makuwa]TYK11593.1 hypothetical protein E5676_scaffold263G00370 [Cucumis melo var. makuwa]
MLSNSGRPRPSGRPPPPLPPNQPNLANPQPASSFRANSSKDKRPISQASALTPMCANNYNAMDLSHQLSSRAKFKILGKILCVEWWDEYDYSHLNEEQIAKWFKVNAHLSREEEDQFLLVKNSVMTTITGAKSEADLQAVMKTVVNNNSDDKKQDGPEDITNLSNSSVNDIDFENNPYYNFDIFDPYLNSQPE